MSLSKSGRTIQYRVCTIVVTYNAMRWAEQCFDSLTTSDYPTDVYVVDNCSKDATVSYIKAKHPEITILESDQNLGFGRANNLAIERAIAVGYDYLFLLNHDAWVEKSTITHLISGFSETSDMGILSPIHLDGQALGLDSKFEEYVAHKRVPNFLRQYHTSSLQNRVYEAPFVNAAAWMISRDACLSVGLFHPLFFHYGEDNNYLSRLFHEGFKLGIVSSARICHDREDRGYNELKDAPNNRFKKQLLKRMLDPTKSSKLFAGWYIFRQFIKEIRRVPFGEKMEFFIWAYGTYRETSNQISAFDQSSLFLKNN